MPVEHNITVEQAIIHRRTTKIQLLQRRVGTQRLRNRLGCLRSDASVCRRESVQEFRRGEEEMRPNAMAWRQQSSRRRKLKQIIHKRTTKIQLLHRRVGAQRLRNRLGSLRSDVVVCQRESVQEFRRGEEQMRPKALAWRQQSSQRSKLNTSSTNAL